MASESNNIATSWVGLENLPLHFANVFGATAGPNAIFLLMGSTVPLALEDGGAGAYIPITPIARVAIAPAAIPRLIEALQAAQADQQEQAKLTGQ